MERNARIIEMREAGVGPREIARRMGVSANVVAGVLYRSAITMESHSINGRDKKMEADERARILEMALCVGAVKTAMVMGVKLGRVTGALNKYRKDNSLIGEPARRIAKRNESLFRDLRSGMKPREVAEKYEIHWTRVYALARRARAEDKL